MDALAQLKKRQRARRGQMTATASITPDPGKAQPDRTHDHEEGALKRYENEDERILLF